MRRTGDTGARLRKPIVYTIVVVVALASGGAAVFLVGSSNRRADQEALLAYEAAVVPAVREGGRAVVREMRPSLREITDGEITPEQLLERTDAWRAVFSRAREDLLALSPPTFLEGIEARWSAAMGAYLATVDAFEAIARADEASRLSMVELAADVGEQADGLFDRAAGVIQFHRRRLDLGPSPNLPDPTPPPAG